MIVYSVAGKVFRSSVEGTESRETFYTLDLDSMFHRRINQRLIAKREYYDSEVWMASEE
jgi:hypothetical protein